MPLVFGDRILSLHVPKTGGNSLGVYLLQTLRRPLAYQSWHQRTEIDHTGVTFIPGNPHANLREAERLTHSFGQELADFSAVLVALRNPYDLEVSRYESFRQQAHDPSLTSRDHELARTLDFPRYLKAFLAPGGEPRSRNLEQMVSIDGQVPPNLKVIRYEHLVADTWLRLREVGIDASAPFPWLNQSEHPAAAGYYTPAAEELVYHAHRWMFDQGLYERLPVAKGGKRSRAKRRA